MIDFGKVLAKSYASNAALDFPAIEASAQKAEPIDKITVRLLTARYLLKHDQKELAEKYIRQCYSTYHGYCADNLLVYQTTRELGLDPIKLSTEKKATK